MTENPAQGAAPENNGPENHGLESNGKAEGDKQINSQPTAPLPAYQPGQDFTAQSNPPRYGAPQHSAALQHAEPQRPDYPAGQGHHYPQHQPFYGGPNPAQHYPTQQFPAAGPGHQMGAAHPGGPAAGPKRKPVFGVGTLVASILAAGLVGGGVVAASDQLFGSRTPVAASSSQTGTVIVNNKDDVNAITAAAAKASPSVVTIMASSGSQGGTGSGIILDDQGHILTNTHVVTLDGASANAAIEVRLSDGRVMKATVVGTDPLSDLAVIKVDNASGLVPATLGDSSKINVGDTAVAIGAPLGLPGTVTDGIVSTLNRTISVASSAVPNGGSDNSQGGGQGGFEFAPPNGSQSQRSASQGTVSLNVIQTDAAINPGNSGGALVSTKGEVIGVNVAIASAGGSNSSSSSSGNIGVGFSIPINNAKRIANEIIKSGKATHGQFGVSVQPKSATGSADGFSVGAEVASVTQGSAAAKAGLKVGDVVTKFAGMDITDPEQLTAAVREQPAGATVKVTIQRGGQSQELDVTLDAAP
ncbi:S1C family serine protease [Arthrobacter sp. AZCC_0090]|uniref:S1C family serine protease n=1 Tax=Arthrobacter sp. AZCC_0090 TaxID=2735881 RepID=UPI0016193D2A|nr:trypsin-like peptidase domain-containing protein [Arthrobacter sp. AZCC_0090]MBB6403872.1 putative serine protease PepD [Arthrobacter sp. AZCC_0090]